MSSPDQNKDNVNAFYDLAFNQRQPEEAVKQYVGSSYRRVVVSPTQPHGR
jgi:predicted SnoaL-like aldol condensation-catalyzing enzyme